MKIFSVLAVLSLSLASLSHDNGFYETDCIFSFQSSYGSNSRPSSSSSSSSSGFELESLSTRINRGRAALQQFRTSEDSGKCMEMLIYFEILMDDDDFKKGFQYIPAFSIAIEKGSQHLASLLAKGRKPGSNRAIELVLDALGRGETEIARTIAKCADVKIQDIMNKMTWLMSQGKEEDYILALVEYTPLMVINCSALQFARVVDKAFQLILEKEVAKGLEAEYLDFISDMNIARCTRLKKQCQMAGLQYIVELIDRHLRKQGPKDCTTKLIQAFENESVSEIYRILTKPRYYFDPVQIEKMFDTSHRNVAFLSKKSTDLIYLLIIAYEEAEEMEEQLRAWNVIESLFMVPQIKSTFSGLESLQLALELSNPQLVALLLECPELHFDGKMGLRLLLASEPCHYELLLPRVRVCFEDILSQIWNLIHTPHEIETIFDRFPEICIEYTPALHLNLFDAVLNHCQDAMDALETQPDQDPTPASVLFLILDDKYRLSKLNPSQREARVQKLTGAFKTVFELLKKRLMIRYLGSHSDQLEEDCKSLGNTPAKKILEYLLE